MAGKGHSMEKANRWSGNNQTSIDQKKELGPSPPTSHPGYLEMDSSPECPATALLGGNLTALTTTGLGKQPTCIRAKAPSTEDEVRQSGLKLKLKIVTL